MVDAAKAGYSLKTPSRTFKEKSTSNLIKMTQNLSALTNNKSKWHPSVKPL